MTTSVLLRTLLVVDTCDGWHGTVLHVVSTLSPDIKVGLLLRLILSPGLYKQGSRMPPAFPTKIPSCCDLLLFPKDC